MLAQLKHTNIVQLKGYTWGPTMVAIIMELVDNGTLGSALLNNDVPLTWADPKLRMATDAARGMSYLHTKRYYDDINKTWIDCVIHRDLKPANMMLTQTFSLKITDFGEARAKDVNATMSMVGTPLYLAPEIIVGERYDEKVRKMY